MLVFQTINPVTGETIRDHSFVDERKVKSTLADLSKAYAKWKYLPVQERQVYLRQWAEVLKTYKQALCEQMHLEMGKSLAEARVEVEKSISCLEYYGDSSQNWFESQKVTANYKESSVVFNPLGVILGIMPWNFPVWQSIRFAAPTLLAGNVVLLKPAEITTGVGQVLAQSAQEAFGELGVVRSLLMDHSTCAQVIADSRVGGVSFTGSTRAGRVIAAQAGQSLKKTVLELGGSDAYVALDDADINAFVQTVTKARLQNCGQSCVAAKRIIVTQKNAEKVSQLLVEMFKQAQLAPLAAKKFQTEISQQVLQLQKLGGEILCGGTLPLGPGAFYPATVVKFSEHPEALNEIEVFGPVALFIVAQDEGEALRFANGTRFGLGGALFSENIERAKKIAEQDWESGFVAINDMVRSDPRLPFGGVKDSGMGRELGEFGPYEFVNIKVVGVGG